MKMNFERFTEEGERLPTGYAIAFVDFVIGRAVCYPVGIHLVVRWARAIWFWTVRHRPSRQERYDRELLGAAHLHTQRMAQALRYADYRARAAEQRYEASVELLARIQALK